MARSPLAGSTFSRTRSRTRRRSRRALVAVVGALAVVCALPMGGVRVTGADRSGLRSLEQRHRVRRLRPQRERRQGVAPDRRQDRHRRGRDRPRLRHARQGHALSRRAARSTRRTGPVASSRSACPATARYRMPRCSPTARSSSVGYERCARGLLRHASAHERHGRSDVRDRAPDDQLRRHERRPGVRPRARTGRHDRARRTLRRERRDRALHHRPARSTRPSPATVCSPTTSAGSRRRPTSPSSPTAASSSPAAKRRRPARRACSSPGSRSRAPSTAPTGPAAGSRPRARRCNPSSGCCSRRARPSSPASIDIPTAGISRYNANGTLDTTFGTGGTARAHVNKFTRLTDLVADASGRLIGVGQAAYSDDFPDVPSFAAIFRYSANGQPDTTFGCFGMTLTEMLGNGTGTNYNASVGEQRGRRRQRHPPRRIRDDVQRHRLPARRPVHRALRR